MPLDDSLLLALAVSVFHIAVLMMPEYVASAICYLKFLAGSFLFCLDRDHASERHKAGLIR
jgi:hypothetical protein